MAPSPAPAPSEVDVFSGPHSRMKRLVQLYSEKLSEVDLSSCSDLRSLLWILKATFSEFKTHEHIENECIMWRLKNRLQFLKVEIAAVSEVHSDNKLSEMVQLVEDACCQADKCTCPKQAAQIGHNLILALRNFTEDFLPHMQEEEEIFQPLLMEYFSYNELKEIKSNVIEKHQKLTKYCPEEKEESEDDKETIDASRTAPDDEEAYNEEVEEEDNTLSKIQGLPAELLLHIFSHLNPLDLSQCSMVCTRWAGLARDPSVWKHLYPSRWAKGNWQFGASVHLPEDIDMESLEQDNDVYVVVDEDADFDESASSAIESDASNASVASYRAECIRREARMLVAMAKYLIPHVGDGVETIILSNSKGVTNGLVYKLLIQCPNLQYLNLSETKISDIAFKGLGKNGVGSKLRHLDLSGCVNITDTTLQRLASIRQPLQTIPDNQMMDTSNYAKPDYQHGVNDKNGRPLNVDPMVSNRDQGCCSRRHNETQHDTDIVNRRQQGSCDGGCHGNNSVSHSQRLSMDTAPRTKSRHDGRHDRSSYHGTGEYEHTDGGNLSRRLQFLSLSGCYRITDVGLGLLSQGGGWPNLAHLDLSGCLNVSGAGLSLLADICPTLNHETFYYCDNIEEGPYADTASGCQNLQCGNRVCCRLGE
ncbi:F-box/LRR-repeat protein 5 [Strongylocentrotus purpuratus]|uniref:F-box/LRR-repeat protein 5 n=1 Tax=Strongylocentrotus purpuratus TaxID=7668 RepID=A0A7M7RCE9_STRPU|nr:F-box/LRR-repeat protein 5 [Strongylocentrotus purpuratus]